MSFSEFILLVNKIVPNIKVDFIFCKQIILMLKSFTSEMKICKAFDGLDTMNAWGCFQQLKCI